MNVDLAQSRFLDEAMNDQQLAAVQNQMLQDIEEAINQESNEVVPTDELVGEDSETTVNETALAADLRSLQRLDAQLTGLNRRLVRGATRLIRRAERGVNTESVESTLRRLVQKTEQVVERFQARSLRTGGDGQNFLVGTDGADAFVDTIERVGPLSIIGLGGDDLIFGGASKDLLIGGEGNDVLPARADDDILIGGEGNDLLAAQDGDDFVITGSGNDNVVGDNGDDVIITGEGVNVVFSSNGEDIIFTGGALNTVVTEDDDDFVLGGDGVELMDGGNGDDVLFAGAGDDAVAGERGNDFIDGGTGNDVLIGGVENDKLFGGLGDDTLFGNEDDDLLDGGAGNDVLRGGDNGSDILTGGEGSDLFILGIEGAVFYDDRGRADVGLITDFALGIDTIQLSGSATDYRLESFGSGASSDSGILAANGDLVGLLEGVAVSELSLTDSNQFVFVG